MIGQATGPYWSGNVILAVELGLSSGTNWGPVALWDVARWDKASSGGWSGIEPDWLPVDPCNLIDVSVTRGRDRWIERYGASTASVEVDDADGRLTWNP